MAAVFDIAKGYLSHIDRSTSGITPLSFFEQQTGLPRSYAVLSGSGVYLALVFLNIGGMGQLLSNIAGFVIPGYYSLIALDTVSKSDDTELLTYWVVFAFLNVVEFWSRAILYWIPFYFLFKTIFLLWAGIPPFGGSKVVYVNIIKPVTDKYIKKSASEKVSEAAEGVSTSVEI